MPEGPSIHLTIGDYVAQLHNPLSFPNQAFVVMHRLMPFPSRISCLGTDLKGCKQVFTLLEAVYGRFDEIAKKKGVFKVETIGDCYVAAAG